MSVHDARVLAFLVWLPTTEDPHDDLRVYAPKVAAAMAEGKSPAQAFNRLPTQYRQVAKRAWAGWSAGHKQALHEADTARARDQAHARATLTAVLHQLQAGEASDGDARDIAWCATQIERLLANQRTMLPGALDLEVEVARLQGLLREAEVREAGERRAVGGTIHQRDVLAHALAGLCRANGTEGYEDSEAMWQAAEAALAILPPTVRAREGQHEHEHYFVVHFRDGAVQGSLIVEPFKGAGARRAAFLTYDERKQGWSEVWLLVPVRAPRADERTL